MKRLALSLTLIMLIFNAGAFEIVIDGYKGGNITVNIIPIGNGTFSQNITVQDNVVRIENITNGSYHLVVSYGTKQFISTISIPENRTVKIDFSETDDADVLRVDNIHFILNLQQGGFSVMEVINFENTAGIYFHGDIVKKIPAGASHLIIDNQTLRMSGVVYDEIIQENGRIVIRNATVQPNGVFSLAYLYFPSESIQLVVDYPADIIRIIHPAQIRITPPEGFVQETQIRNDQGVVFNVLKAENLKPGTYSLNAEVAQGSTTQMTAPPENQNQGLNLPLIAGVTLIAAGIVLFILTSRKKEKEDEEEEEREEKTGGWEIQ